MRNRLLNLTCLIALLALPTFAHAVVEDMSLKTITGHTGALNAVAASVSRIATGSSDGTVKLWSTNGDTLFQTLPMPDGGSVFSLAFSPDGSQLAVGTGMHGVWLYDVATGTVVRQFEGLTGTIMSISFSTDGRIAAGDNMGDIAVWGVVPGGVPLAVIAHGYAVRALLFSADNNHL
ncbi:MAG TPA: hypothetical protein PKN69_09140, partial [Candidatus Latescibacteria bacterium]|nr:hypothetical protein [Candidatus Latescibacterota bacterium]